MKTTTQNQGTLLTQEEIDQIYAKDRGIPQAHEMARIMDAYETAVRRLKERESSPGVPPAPPAPATPPDAGARPVRDDARMTLRKKIEDLEVRADHQIYPDCVARLERLQALERYAREVHSSHHTAFREYALLGYLLRCEGVRFDPLDYLARASPSREAELAERAR